MNPTQAIRKLRDVIRQVRARGGVRQAQKQKAKETVAERTVTRTFDGRVQQRMERTLRAITPKD
jgi:hypothetical protein